MLRAKRFTLAKQCFIAVVGKAACIELKNG
jgi:hypothetical protein